MLARVAPGTGQSLIGLVVRKGGAPHIHRMAQALYEERDRQMAFVRELLNRPDATVLVMPVGAKWTSLAIKV